jgi:aminoglycoside phosphotransferase (APT) family kinase protein
MSGLAVAPISPDEIRDYLATQLPDATDLVLHDVAQIAVGWSHETWLFDLHYRQGGENQVLGLCLRRDPGNALLRHLSDLGEQFRVLKCLERTNLPTPKAYWYESDSSILGAPFLVMEKVAGSCPSPWGREGRAFYKGIPTPGRGFAEREIVKWRELIATTEHPPEPILTDLIGWLETNIPPTERVTLVHGAYRTGNLLIDNDRVSAVLDWELQVLGDPMYDVAYVLSDLNREGTHLLSNLVERDAFIRDYEAATGFTVDEDACRYYNALYAMRSVAFWMSASDLYATGRSNDIRLARTAWSVPVVLDRAARDLGY